MRTFRLQQLQCTFECCGLYCFNATDDSCRDTGWRIMDTVHSICCKEHLKFYESYFSFDKVEEFVFLY